MKWRHAATADDLKTREEEEVDFADATGKHSRRPIERCDQSLAMHSHAHPSRRAVRVIHIGIDRPKPYPSNSSSSSMRNTSGAVLIKQSFPRQSSGVCAFFSVRSHINGRTAMSRETCRRLSSERTTKRTSVASCMTFKRDILRTESESSRPQAGAYRERLKRHVRVSSKNRTVLFVMLLQLRFDFVLFLFLFGSF